MLNIGLSLEMSFLCTYCLGENLFSKEIPILVVVVYTTRPRRVGNGIELISSFPFLCSAVVLHSLLPKKPTG